MSERNIVVYGAGAQAREIAWLADECTAAGDPNRVVAFIDDDPATHGREVSGIPVHGLESARATFPQALMIIGVGGSSARATLATRGENAGFAFATLVHPGVIRSQRVSIGDGTIVCAGCVVSVDVSIGRHVHLNLNCSISHDSVIDDFATLAPGVILAGFVHVGRCTWLGVGSVVSNGTSSRPMVIGAGSIVGAGACVVSDVDAGTTVVGVPAKVLVRN